MKTLTIIGILAIFSLSGCATIFKGSDADIRVNSTPSGATVLVDGIDKGATPQTLALKRSNDHVLTFKMDGYEDVTVAINKKFDLGTTVIGNIFSWGLIGIIVDVANGSAYSLEPADVQANLNAMQAAGYLPDPESTDPGSINVIMLTPEQWKAISDHK